VAGPTSNGNGVWKWIAGTLAALIVGVLIGLLPGYLARQDAQEDIAGIEASVEELETRVAAVTVQLARVEERLDLARERIEEIIVILRAPE
jgi:hypothetical protein